MEPKFSNGQTVFIKLQDDCPDGSYGVFAITDIYETMVVFKQKVMISKTHFYLHSLNNTFPDITDLANKICKCIGVVLLK